MSKTADNVIRLPARVSLRLVKTTMDGFCSTLAQGIDFSEAQRQLDEAAERMQEVTFGMTAQPALDAAIEHQVQALFHTLCAARIPERHQSLFLALRAYAAAEG